MFTNMPRETDLIQLQIKLTDDTPIGCKPYPLPYAMREELWNKVDNMLEIRDRRHYRTCRLLSW